MDLGRMDDCTSASGAASWRNVRRDWDNGTDSDFILVSLGPQVPESGIVRVEVPFPTDHLVSTILPGKKMKSLVRPLC